MKFTFTCSVFLVLVILSSQLFAQQRGPKISYGIHTGSNSARIQHKVPGTFFPGAVEDQNVTTKNKRGNYSALFAEIHFSNRFSVQFELALSQKGSKNLQTESISVYEEAILSENIRINYFEFPILFKFYPIRDRVELCFMLGLARAWEFSRNNRSKYTFLNIEQDRQEKIMRDMDHPLINRDHREQQMIIGYAFGLACGPGKNYLRKPLSLGFSDLSQRLDYHLFNRNVTFSLGYKLPLNH